MNSEVLTKLAIEEILLGTERNNSVENTSHERKKNPLGKANKRFLGRIIKSAMSHNKSKEERDLKVSQEKLIELDNDKDEHNEKSHRRSADKKEKRHRTDYSSSSSSDENNVEHSSSAHRKSKKKRYYPSSKNSEQLNEDREIPQHAYGPALHAQQYFNNYYTMANYHYQAAHMMATARSMQNHIQAPSISDDIYNEVRTDNHSDVIDISTDEEAESTPHLPLKQKKCIYDSDLDIELSLDSDSSHYESSENNNQSIDFVNLDTSDEDDCNDNITVKKQTFREQNITSSSAVSTQIPSNRTIELSDDEADVEKNEVVVLDSSDEDEVESTSIDKYDKNKNEVSSEDVAETEKKKRKYNNDEENAENESANPENQFLKNKEKGNNKDFVATDLSSNVAKKVAINSSQKSAISIDENKNKDDKKMSDKLKNNLLDATYKPVVDLSEEESDMLLVPQLSNIIVNPVLNVNSSKGFENDKVSAANVLASLKETVSTKLKKYKEKLENEEVKDAAEVLASFKGTKTFVHVPEIKNQESSALNALSEEDELVESKGSDKLTATEGISNSLTKKHEIESKEEECIQNKENEVTKSVEESEPIKVNENNDEGAAALTLSKGSKAIEFEEKNDKIEAKKEEFVQTNKTNEPKNFEEKQLHSELFNKNVETTMLSNELEKKNNENKFKEKDLVESKEANEYTNLDTEFLDKNVKTAVPLEISNELLKSEVTNKSAENKSKEEVFIQSQNSEILELDHLKRSYESLDKNVKPDECKNLPLTNAVALSDAGNKVFGTQLVVLESSNENDIKNIEYSVVSEKDLSINLDNNAESILNPNPAKSIDKGEDKCEAFAKQIYYEEGTPPGTNVLHAAEIPDEDLLQEECDLNSNQMLGEPIVESVPQQLIIKDNLSFNANSSKEDLLNESSTKYKELEEKNNIKDEKTTKKVTAFQEQEPEQDNLNEGKVNDETNKNVKIAASEGLPNLTLEKVDQSKGITSSNISMGFDLLNNCGDMKTKKNDLIQAEESDALQVLVVTTTEENELENIEKDTLCQNEESGGG